MEVCGLALASLSLVVSVPREMPEAHRRELLLGCSNVLAPERCVENAEASPQAWVEVLEDDRVGLEVELHEPNAQGSATRELNFSPADDPVERARAVGLSLGLMAKALQTRPQEAEDDEPSEPVEVAPATERASEPPPPKEAGGALAREEARPAKASRRQQAKVEPDTNAEPSPIDVRSLSLGLEAGAAFDPGIDSVEGGGLVRVESRPLRVLGFVASADFRAGPAADGDLSVRRISPTLGILLSGRWRSVETLAMLEAGAQGLHLVLRGADSAHTRWYPVIVLGASLRVPAHSRLQFTVTPRLSFAPSRTVVRIDDVPTYTTAPFCPSIDLGVLWSPKL